MLFASRPDFPSGLRVRPRVQLILRRLAGHSRSHTPRRLRRSCSSVGRTARGSGWRSSWRSSPMRVSSPTLPRRASIWQGVLFSDSLMPPGRCQGAEDPIKESSGALALPAERYALVEL